MRPARCLRAPQRDGAALTQVRWLRASQSPPTPMQRRQVGSPGFNKLPPLQADKMRQTRQRLNGPLLPRRGAAGRHPGEPRPHPTTSRVTPRASDTLFCPGLKQKPNHSPKLKKQPLENDRHPLGSWTGPRALPGGHSPVLTHRLHSGHRRVLAGGREVGC